MFERMETTEKMYEGVVTPSYIFSVVSIRSNMFMDFLKIKLTHNQSPEHTIACSRC